MEFGSFSESRKEKYCFNKWTVYRGKTLERVDKLRQEFFIRFLSDGKREISQDQIDKRLRRVQLEWMQPPFVFVQISAEYIDVSPDVMDQLLFDMVDAVEDELRSKGYRSFCFLDSYENINVVLTLRHYRIDSNTLDNLFVDVHKMMTDKYGYPLFIGIGSVVEQLGDLDRSAGDASEMLGYKYFYAAKGVANIANIAPFRRSSSIANNIAFDRVIGCFLDGNIGKMSVRLDELIEQVRNRPNVSKISIKHTFVELTAHILHIAAINNIDSAELMNGQDFYHWILSQNHTEVLQEWFMRLSATLMEKMVVQKQNKESAVIQQAKEYVEQNLTDQTLGVPSVSAHVGLSEVYFGQMFKRETGLGISQYITQARLEQAKRYLTETAKQNAEIAELVGFSSSNYFHQVFKKHLGMSPGVYRKMNRT